MDKPETCKKRLCHRCFPVNFAKFLGTPFSPNTSGRLLLQFRYGECKNRTHFPKFTWCKWEKVDAKNFLHINFRLHGNFHENMKKHLAHFFNRNFWLIDPKMDEDEKSWKNKFVFSISKLGSGNLHENLRKKIWPIS